MKLRVVGRSKGLVAVAHGTADGTIRIRLDDENDLPFWAEIELTARQLELMDGELGIEFAPSEE